MRVIIDASNDIVAVLEEDDQTVFGESFAFDSATSSSDEFGDDAAAAKRPYAEESWWEDESEGDLSGSGSPDGEVTDPLANVEAVGQLHRSLVHDGCSCHGANHFTAFQHVPILHI